MDNRVYAVSGLLLAGLFSTAAVANTPSQGDAYVGGGFSMAEYSEDLDNSVFVQDETEVDQNLIFGRLGYGLTDYIAIEGRLGTGISDDSLDLDVVGQPNVDFNAEISTNWFAGAYGVGYIPISDGFSLYGLAGVTHFDLDANFTTNLGDNESLSGSATEFSYGVGSQFSITESISGYGEWVNYGEDGDEEISGFGAGIVYHY